MHDFPKAILAQELFFCVSYSYQVPKLHGSVICSYSAVIPFLFLCYKLHTTILSQHFFFMPWSWHQLEVLKRWDYKDNHRQVPSLQSWMYQQYVYLSCLGIKLLAGTASIIPTCLINGSMMCWHSNKQSCSVPWKWRTWFLHFSFIKQ